MTVEIATTQKTVRVSADYKTVQVVGGGFITGGGGGGGNTNLAYTASPTNGIVTSDTGTDATIPLVSTNAGLMSPSDKTKLDGVATGATANSSDATLLNRANHTGEQAISTVTGLQTALDGKQATGDYATNTALTNGLATKENTITAGTTGQYYRGDKTFQTLDKTAVGLSNVANVDTTTTANITDSSNKRFITDAQQTVLGNTSGANTGDNATNSSKQDTLVSGTNIKTINGTTLLGGGDITLSSGGLTQQQVMRLAL
jgi:hypothetical protein